MIDLSKKYVIGLMSGTSLDGVDAVLATFDPSPCIHGSAYIPFPEAIKARLFKLNSPAQNELHELNLIANELAVFYAEAVGLLLEKTGVNKSQVLAIGNHGQTIRHRPECGYTVQIGNHAKLAELTGIAVIGDFRARDIAAGGQGAPLVPAFHQQIFQNQEHAVAVFNIGGIANVTWLGCAGSTVYGFDSGPGNALLDYWCKQHLNKDYDESGNWARTGVVISELLEEWLATDFFHLPPPKSTGRDLFNPTWLAGYDLSKYAPEDVQATLTKLTAVTIVDALERYAAIPEMLYLCGGGVRNNYLVELIAADLPNTVVKSTDEIGAPSDTLEAFAFAWLAWRFCHGLAGNLPEVTGADGPRVLGVLHPG